MHLGGTARRHRQPLATAFACGCRVCRVSSGGF